MTWIINKYSGIIVICLYTIMRLGLRLEAKLNYFTKMFFSRFRTKTIQYVLFNERLFIDYL